MDVRVNERNPAVRVHPVTELAVFALMAGLCAMTVFAFLGAFTSNNQPQVPVLVAGAAVIAGVLGMLIVPRVLYTNEFTAMFIGVLVALLSHIPFSILWALGEAMLNPPFAFSEFSQDFAVLLVLGYLFGGIAEIIFGALAGYICYRKGVPFEERD